ncbi:matrix metalloproteinase-14-like isoform X1 [Leptotrombidium deliense]|uniref:Matrix metalloproteinase-14-like isoform X1 n=1 Tax=Leptotrombidium deliense TaxID=299467 RepID=A0A443S4A4_9ACAR|nr:matrix metalloproteinase-14-like isoform X1 [Leptotrombidium deliense]
MALYTSSFLTVFINVYVTLDSHVLIFSLLFIVDEHWLNIKHKQINVEIDALALFQKDSKFASGVVFTNFTFNYFSGYWDENGEFSTYPVLQGFLYPNELFFGCPQIFCFAADVDTVMLDKNDIGYVFRGKYFWNWYPSKMLTVRSAKQISTVFNGLPDHLDASFTNKDGITFVFKNNKVYKSDDKLKINYYVEKSQFKSIATNNLNAVWFHGIPKCKGLIQ